MLCTYIIDAIAVRNTGVKFHSDFIGFRKQHLPISKLQLVTLQPLWYLGNKAPSVFWLVLRIQYSIVFNIFANFVDCANKYSD